jgi:hypothetical protein
MVRDIEGQGDEEAALEWGVEFDLAEGEELPADHEKLTEAQFTVFQFMQTLKGVFEDAEVGEIRGEAPSRLIVPKENLG